MITSTKNMVKNIVYIFIVRMREIKIQLSTFVYYQSLSSKVTLSLSNHKNEFYIKIVYSTSRRRFEIAIDN